MLVMVACFSVENSVTCLLGLFQVPEISECLSAVLDLLTACLGIYNC